jgi:hypothetical protein
MLRKMLAFLLWSLVALPIGLLTECAARKQDGFGGAALFSAERGENGGAWAEARAAPAQGRISMLTISPL